MKPDPAPLYRTPNDNRHHPAPVDDIFTLPDPIIITGAVEDTTFTLPAPGVLTYAQPSSVGLSVTNYTQPPTNCATVAVQTNGTLVLTPAADYSGNCSFGITVVGDAGLTLSTTVDVVVG